MDKLNEEIKVLSEDPSDTAIINAQMSSNGDDSNLRCTEEVEKEKNAVQQENGHAEEVGFEAKKKSDNSKTKKDTIGVTVEVKELHDEAPGAMGGLGSASSVEDDLGWQGISVSKPAANLLEVEWLHDGETLLQLAPEEDYLGAKLMGFLPEFGSGEPSALELSNYLKEGDVVVELNGTNVRDLEFMDILRSVKPTDQGGMPRPLRLMLLREEPEEPAEETNSPESLRSAINKKGFFSSFRNLPKLDPLDKDALNAATKESATMRFLFGDNVAGQSQDGETHKAVPRKGLFRKRQSFSFTNDATPNKNFFGFRRPGPSSTAPDSVSSPEVMTPARLSLSDRLEGLELEGGATHSKVLMATCGNQTLGAKGTDDAVTMEFLWWRSSGDSFSLIEGVTGPFYHPSLDDVGEIVRVTVLLPDSDSEFSAESGVIQMDPVVRERADGMIQLGCATFSGLKNREKPGENYRLRVGETCGLSTYQENEQGDGQLNFECNFSDNTTITLDATRLTTFTLELSAMVKIQLLADSWEDREVIAITFRAFKEKYKDAALSLDISDLEDSEVLEKVHPSSVESETGRESYLDELGALSDSELGQEVKSPLKSMELQAAQLYEKWDRTEQKRKRLEKELGETVDEKMRLTQEGTELRTQMQLMVETQDQREAEYQELRAEVEQLRKSLQEGKEALQIAMFNSEEASAKLGSHELIVKALKEEADEANRQKELMRKEMEIAKCAVQEREEKMRAGKDAERDLNLQIKKLKDDLKRTEAEKVASQKTAKGLENDVRVLNASKEVRDQKIHHLENQLAIEQKEAEQSRGKSREISQLKDQLAKLKRDYEGGIQMQLQLEKQVEAADNACKAAEKTAEECMEKMQQLHEDLQEQTNKVTRLTTQRNSFKSKAESLARDLTRLCRGKTAADIEHIVNKYEELQVQVSVLRAERDHATDEAKTYKEALDGAKEAQERSKNKGAAQQAVAQSLEMQRLLASLTETIGEKDIQLEALRNSNKVLAQRLMELEKS